METLQSSWDSVSLLTHGIVVNGKCDVNVKVSGIKYMFSTYYIKVVIKILCDRGLENKNILFSQISFHIKGQEHFKLYFSIN